MKRLVVIDGKSVFYRGYYAMGALSLKDGTPTGGVFGFAAIAMEIVKKLNPDKVVVAWDKAKTSISKRKAIFDGYKAGRVKPPEDFFAQIPLLRELIEGLNWGFLECDDYEADDIIGTLGREVTEWPDWEMYIISSDMDMLQVVNPRVKMYRLLKGFSEIEEMDVRAVEEKYGIKKAQFLDLKALKGDASDNIPGVPGVGEKTAVKLLGEYGSLAGIYENIEKITGATRKKLEVGKESAEMSYKLAKIMTDAPVLLEDIPDFVVDKEKMRNALLKLEFSSLIRKFGLGEDGKADAVNLENNNEQKNAPINEYLIEWDIKEKMHADGEFCKKVFETDKIWDLTQGAFLIDPLKPLETGNLLRETTEEKNREFERQWREFEKNPKLMDVMMNFDMPMVKVLYKMEDMGMKIDRGYFLKLREEFAKKTETLVKEIWELSGTEFNVNSPIRLSEVLFNKLGLPTDGIKKTTRGYSTGAKELNKLFDKHPVIAKLVEYREAAKLLSTYINPILSMADENDRVHTTYTQNVTATGRLSSVNPNLQNIPVRSEEGKKIKEGFVADEGKVLISADYSQFELRLAAVLSNDTVLVKDFESGVDIHTKTASEAFNVAANEVTKEQRRAAKVINFGVLYGMSAKGLSEQTGMSLSEASEFIKRYFELRKPMKEYLDNVLKQAKEKGYVETAFGRRRPTPDVKSPNFAIRMAAERAAQNMPIQGTEADLMKRAMTAMDAELPEGARLVAQVHDSLTVECNEEQAEEVIQIMKWVMENVAPELPIRLDIETEVGEKW